MVIAVPTTPEVGCRLVMFGAGVLTVKLALLLAIPPTVTTTLPLVAPLGTVTAMLVAFQFAGVALVPLNVTVLVPCVEPKFVPVMVTAVPTTPDVGFRLVMFGAVVLTATVASMLAIPPTHTTALPGVALAGTATAILVAFHSTVVPVAGSV